MSRRSTPKSGIKNQPNQDVSIPSDFQNGNEIVTNRKYRQFLQYLLDDSVCPFPQDIANKLIPKPYTTDEFIKKEKAFWELYESNSSLFRRFPLFSLLYIFNISRLIQVTYKDDFVSCIRKINGFVNTIQTAINEKVLDIIIPLTISRISSDDSPVMSEIIMTLIKKFTIPVFLPHFLSSYTALYNMSDLNNFHVNLLTQITQEFTLESEDILEIQSTIDKFTTGRTRIALQGLKESLNKQTQEGGEIPASPSRRSGLYSPSQGDGLYSPSRRDGMYSPSRRDGLNSPSRRDGLYSPSGRNSLYSPSKISPSRSTGSPGSYRGNNSSFLNLSFRSVTPEDFTKLLDDLESSNYTSVMGILNDIKDSLEKLKDFPDNRSVEPLFNLAMTTYREKLITSDNKKQLYLLITSVNNYCDPIQLVQLYLKNQNNKKIANDFLERCYQHFLKTSAIRDKMAEGKANLDINELPISLVVQSDIPQRNDVELAFNYLTEWNTSYSGAKEVWRIIKEEPDIDLNPYFDSLQMTQKCFLIEALRSWEEIEDAYYLQEVIDNLEILAQQETKSDRVAREAKDITEKLDEVALIESPKIKKHEEYLRSPSSKQSIKDNFSPTISTREMRNSPRRSPTTRTPDSSRAYSPHNTINNIPSAVYSGRYQGSPRYARSPNRNENTTTLNSPSYTSESKPMIRRSARPSPIH